MVRRLFLLLISSAAIAGCSAPAPSSLSIDRFEALPSAVPVTGGNVQLTWSTTGALRAALANEVVGTSGDKTLFVTPGQVLSLTASTNERTVTSEVVIGTVTLGKPVTGTVVNHKGQPLPAADVAIGPYSAKTDSAGRFTIIDAARPYDAQVSATDYALMNFVGLTGDEVALWTENYRNDPYSNFAALQATVTGRVDGGPDSLVEVVAVGPESYATETFTPPIGRHIPLRWNEDAGADFMLFAYQYEVRHPDQPRYLVAADPLRLSVGAGDVRSVSMNMTEPDKAIARANVTLPPWASYAIVSEYLRMPGFTPLLLDTVSRTTGTIAAELPAWDAGTFHFSLLATRNATTACEPSLSVRALTEALPLDGGVLDVVLGDAPTPSPCLGGTISRDGAIRWEYLSSTLCEVHVFDAWTGSGANFFTTFNTIAVSAMPNAQFADEYSWQLTCYPDFTSTADALSTDFLEVRSGKRPGRSATAWDLKFKVQ